MAFISITDADIANAAFWAGLNINANSTINATAISAFYQITITGNSISFTDTNTGTLVASYTNADLSAGSFSNVRRYQGNDNASDVSGATGAGQNVYTGGAGDDTLTDDGTSGGALVGNAGNDVLSGGTGNNYNISGGDGEDLLRSGNGGNNQVRGGNDADTLIGEGGGGNLRGEAGNDTIIREDGNYNVVGGDGDDTIILEGGSGSVAGNGGNDTIIAESDTGSINAGSGNDTIITQGNTGTITAGAGDDTVILEGPNSGFISGGGGANFLVLPAGATFSPFNGNPTSGTITFADGSGGQYSGFDEDNISVACFAGGTLIETISGPVAVDELRPGDRVQTLDNGACEIRWIGKRDVPAHDDFAPICISKGTMGNWAELYVSPQHRILVSGPFCDLLFGAPEALCAAKHLCNGDQIYRAPRTSITYFHLMFDTHQIITANGVLAESFFVGEHHLTIDSETRDEIFSLFPELQSMSHPARKAARPLLNAYEARLFESHFDRP